MDNVYNSGKVHEVYLYKCVSYACIDSEVSDVF